MVSNQTTEANSMMAAVSAFPSMKTTIFLNSAGSLLMLKKLGETARLPNLAESLVMASGRPIILFPPGGTVTRLRRILVAWNPTREAIRAVADALPLLVRAETVEVLVVDHQSHQGSHGQEPGADIARHLARHGVQAEARRPSSGGEDVDHLLLSRAADFGADLLVMGAYGHSHLTEWMFGGVTRNGCA